jgi:hypothetical protein
MGQRAVGRGWARIGAGLLTIAVGGCGAGSYGFAPDTSDYNHSAVANLLAFNSLKAPSPAPAATDATKEKLQCPTIEVLDGTASSRVYAGADQSNNNVRYQFSMGDVVRECSHVGGDLVLKVGVEGRALLGPAGSPGAFTAPVRIAIRREKDEKVVSSTLLRAPVTIAGGETGAPFVLVSDPIIVPFTSANEDSDYTVIVGFDSKGDAKAPAPRKAHSRGGA